MWTSFIASDSNIGPSGLYSLEADFHKCCFHKCCHKIIPKSQTPAACIAAHLTIYSEDLITNLSEQCKTMEQKVDSYNLPAFGHQNQEAR